MTSAFQRVIGYVMQSDALFPMLTVKETLLFSARLRLPQEMGYTEKRKRVDMLIEELGLQSCADTVIGNEEVSGLSHICAPMTVSLTFHLGWQVRGVSGGERRRVSIGVDLIHNPRVLLLDEPTSGEDFESESALPRDECPDFSLIILSLPSRPGLQFCPARDADSSHHRAPTASHHRGHRSPAEFPHSRAHRLLPHPSGGLRGLSRADGGDGASLPRLWNIHSRPCEWADGRWQVGGRGGMNGGGQGTWRQVNVLEYVLDVVEEQQGAEQGLEPLVSFHVRTLSTMWPTPTPPGLRLFSIVA